MYQRCPICNGTGVVGGFDNKCEVCNGTKIIDEMTGLPPARMNNLEKPKENMFDAAIRSVRERNFDVTGETFPQTGRKFSGEIFPEPLDFDGAKLAKEKWDKFKHDRKGKEWMTVFLTVLP